MIKQTGAGSSNRWPLQAGVRELLTDEHELTRAQVVSRLCGLLGTVLPDLEGLRQETIEASGIAGDLQRTALVGSLTGATAVTRTVGEALSDVQLVAATMPPADVIAAGPTLAVVPDTSTEIAA